MWVQGVVCACCRRCLQTCILLPACPVLGPSWQGWDGSGDLGGRCRCAQGASWMFLSPQACGQAGFPVVGIRGHSAWPHSALSTCCGWWGWRSEPHLSQEPCMGGRGLTGPRITPWASSGSRRGDRGPESSRPCLRSLHISSEHITSSPVPAQASTSPASRMVCLSWQSCGE